MAAHLGEWETLLERSKGANDRLFYVDYADVPVVRAEGTGEYSGSNQATRTRLAIQFALSQMQHDRASRLLALTDGFSTEPLTDIGERLVRQGVSLDYQARYPPGRHGLRDHRPASAGPFTARAKPFIIELDVAGAPDATVPFRVSRDGQELRGGEVVIRNGQGVARIHRTGSRPAERIGYGVRLTPAVDARPGNNTAENWTEIVGGPRLLLVTDYSDDPAAGAVARAGGSMCRAVTALSTLDAAMLTGTRGRDPQ